MPLLELNENHLPQLAKLIQAEARYDLIAALLLLKLTDKKRKGLKEALEIQEEIPTGEIAPHSTELSSGQPLEIQEEIPTGEIDLTAEKGFDQWIAAIEAAALPPAAPEEAAAPEENEQKPMTPAEAAEMVRAGTQQRNLGGPPRKQVQIVMHTLSGADKKGAKEPSQRVAKIKKFIETAQQARAGKEYPTEVLTVFIAPESYFKKESQTRFQYNGTARREKSD